MEEEDNLIHIDSVDYQELPVHKCICGHSVSMSSTPSEEIEISERKQFILNTVAKAESYLRERRIPELIRYLLIMLLAHSPDKPVAYLEQLLADCMLFRAGHGVAPVIYEKRHLEAVMKSFDPSQRGWLNAGQVNRLYATLGFNCEESIEDKISCDILLNSLVETQEIELFNLLTAYCVLKSDDII